MVNTSKSGTSVTRHPRQQFGQGSSRHVTKENKITGMIAANQNCFFIK